MVSEDSLRMTIVIPDRAFLSWCLRVLVRMWYYGAIRKRDAYMACETLAFIWPWYVAEHPEWRR